MGNQEEKERVPWRKIGEGTTISCQASSTITFDGWDIPEGTAFTGTFLGIDETDDVFRVYLYVTEYAKRLGIQPRLLRMKLTDAAHCFRCDRWRPSSDFHRHYLVPDTSPILSEVCSGCYKKVKNKVAEHRSNANRYGGEKTLTASEWLNILRSSGGHCHYCKIHVGYTDLIMEHQVPISWKGGHTKENVVPACISCNSSKGDRDVETWQRHNEAKHLTELLQNHFQLSKFEVVNLAIKRLAIQEGLISDEEEAGND